MTLLRQIAPIECSVTTDGCETIQTGGRRTCKPSQAVKRLGQTRHRADARESAALSGAHRDRRQRRNGSCSTGHIAHTDEVIEQALHFCCGAFVRFWHLAEKPRSYSFVRSGG